MSDKAEKASEKVDSKVSNAKTAESKALARKKSDAIEGEFGPVPDLGFCAGT